MSPCRCVSREGVGQRLRSSNFGVILPKIEEEKSSFHDQFIFGDSNTPKISLLGDPHADVFVSLHYDNCSTSRLVATFPIRLKPVCDALHSDRNGATRINKSALTRSSNSHGT
jgi:hypothetical protein